MIPFYKVFSLLLRVFSRPLLNYTKRVHSSGEAQSLRLRVMFIYLGNFYHRCDSAINRRFLKIESQFAFKPLNEQLALQKGIDFFYQMLFYSIVIGLPMYQIYRASAQSAAKSADVDKRLSNLENGTSNALKTLQQAVHNIWGINIQSIQNEQERKRTQQI